MPVYSSPRCGSWHAAPDDHPEPATDVRCSFAAGHPPNRHAAAGITWTDDEGHDLLAEYGHDCSHTSLQHGADGCNVPGCRCAFMSWDES